MNKKATIKIVVGITILLVFLAVILISFFCPTCLAPNIAKGAERIGDSILSGLGGEKFEKTFLAVEPQYIEVMYNDIVDKLKTPGVGPCILEHRQFDNDFNKYKIVLSLKEGNTLAKLINKKDQVVRKNTIARREPCYVIPENFYNNFLGDTRCYGPPPDCPINYQVTDLLFKDDDDIYIDTIKKDLKEENLLFKTRDGNVCFFPTKRGGGCSSKGEGLEEGCFKDDGEIPEKVPTCTNLRLNRPKIPIGNSGTSEAYSGTSKAYYQIDDYSLDIKWTNPVNVRYSLRLTTKGTPLDYGIRDDWDIYYGGHTVESAPVVLSEKGLTGVEVLRGIFSKYNLDDSFIQQYQEFEIDLKKRTPSYPKLRTEIIKVEKGLDQGAVTYMVTYKITNKASISQECDELFLLLHKGQIDDLKFRNPIILDKGETKSTQFAIYTTDLELGKVNTLQVGCGSIDPTLNDEYNFIP